MADSVTTIRQLPAYMQEYDEALLQRIFGAPDDEGVLTGGIIDDPDLFGIPDYVQAGRNPLQESVVNSFGTEEQRQAFMDRYQPYFTDENGIARYLPQASQGLGAGASTIAGSLANYFPEAQNYLRQGTGGIDTKGFYDTETAEAKARADQSTQLFDAQQRANDLLSDSRSAIKGGLGQFDPSSVDKFMNPYKEQVLDTTLAKIDRQAAQRRQADAANAISKGAFGGSRSGVQAAETERAIEEARQGTIANVMSQGYDKSLAGAQAAYENAAKRGIAGGQQLGSLSTSQLGAEAKSFEGAEGRMLKAADMYRSMGLSSAEAQTRAAEDERKRNLETGRLMGGLGASSGQLGGAQADIGKAYGSLAGTSADIGQVYAGMAPKDLGFMYEVGGKEQAYDQQAQDFYRQNQLATTQQALAPYSYAQNYLTGAPSASMYSQYSQGPSTAPNPFLQGVGMYATYQGANR